MEKKKIFGENWKIFDNFNCLRSKKKKKMEKRLAVSRYNAANERTPCHDERKDLRGARVYRPTLTPARGAWVACSWPGSALASRRTADNSHVPDSLAHVTAVTP